MIVTCSFISEMSCHRALKSFETVLKSYPTLVITESKNNLYSSRFLVLGDFLSSLGVYLLDDATTRGLPLPSLLHLYSLKLRFLVYTPKKMNKL